MVLKYLLQKEFLQIRRSVFLPKLILMFPIVIMCVMPWVMNMEIKNIVVEVVDNDKTSLSQRLVHRIEASNYFIFHGEKGTYMDALRNIEKSEADVVLEIPRGFEKKSVSGEQPEVMIAANAVNAMKGSMASRYLASIVKQHLTGQDSHTMNGIEMMFLYNKNLDYKLFMIPSLMAIILMLLCGLLPALNIVGEKEAGTIEAINVTPVSKLIFILAKLIPYWIIGMIVISICFLIAWGVYGITSTGSLFTVYLLSILLSFVFSGIGLVISNYNDTMQQSLFVMWFLLVCLILLSGLFTPVRSMPSWAYLTTYINPMHYYIDAIRTVFVRGGDIRSIQTQLIVLSIFAFAMDCWAVVSYRKNGQ